MTPCKNRPISPYLGAGVVVGGARDVGPPLLVLGQAEERGEIGAEVRVPVEALALDIGDVGVVPGPGLASDYAQRVVEALRPREVIVHLRDLGLVGVEVALEDDLEATGELAGPELVRGLGELNYIRVVGDNVRDAATSERGGCVSSSYITYGRGGFARRCSVTFLTSARCR